MLHGNIINDVAVAPIDAVVRKSNKAQPSLRVIAQEIFESLLKGMQLRFGCTKFECESELNNRLGASCTVDNPSLGERGVIDGGNLIV